ncbi:MAG: hypothetical protein PHI48_11380 [Bacteroidales bacterium]|nr:hypothetical protein [Bacteroidales bacterium]
MNRYISMIDDPGASWNSHTMNQVNIDEIRLCFLTTPDSDTHQREKQREVLDKIIGEYISTISSMPEDVFSGILNSTSLVCNSLDFGLELLSRNAQILGRTLDARLSLVYEQDMITRLMSEDLVQLFRIPDIQKDRLLQIEKALQSLQKAFYEVDYYNQALRYLLEAERSEPSDYIVLYFIGMIYLYAVPCMDLPKAESYFRKASVFSRLDTNPNAVKLADIASSDYRMQHSSLPESQKIQMIASEAFFQAALASFFQRKYSEAAELSSMAFELNPYMHEAAYYACLSSGLAGNKEQTLKWLEELVNKMPLYAVVAACDPLLASRDYVQEWMKTLKQNTVNEASLVLDDLEAHLLKSSIYVNDLQNVRVKLYEADYLDAVELQTSLKQKIAVSLRKENEEYEMNKEGVSFLKGVIGDYNRMIIKLKKNSFSHVPAIKGVDPKVTDEFDTILSPDYSTPVNQSQVAERIAAMIHSIDKRYEENDNELEATRNILLQKIAEHETDRLGMGENLLHLNMLVAGFAPFAAVIAGLFGYFQTPDTIGNVDEYMLPWINFFIGLFSVSILFVVVYQIIRTVKRRCYKSSLLEINLGKEIAVLDEFIIKFDEIKMLLYA